MWIEKTPEPEDTVMVEFADFTHLGTKIGVVLREDCNGGIPVQFGDCKRFLDRFSTFFVYQKTKCIKPNIINH